MFAIVLNLFWKSRAEMHLYLHVLWFLLRINFFICRNFRGTSRNTALEWHLFSICVKCFFMTVMPVPQKQSVTLSSRLHAIWTEGGGTFVQCQWKGDLSKSVMPTVFLSTCTNTGFIPSSLDYNISTLSLTSLTSAPRKLIISLVSSVPFRDGSAQSTPTLLYRK